MNRYRYCKNLARGRGICPTEHPYNPAIWCGYCQAKAGIGRVILRQRSRGRR